MLNNFVIFYFLFPKLSGIDPVGMLGEACSKLEAMAIYLVKQACGNDKLAYVYPYL